MGDKQLARRSPYCFHPKECVRIDCTTASQSRPSSIARSARVRHCEGTALRPPNGLPISCRERATTSIQKTNDLAREAVNCNAVLGGALVEYRIPIGKKSCGMPRNVIRIWSLRCDRSFGTRFGLPNATAK